MFGEGWVRSYIREDVKGFRKSRWVKEISEEDAEHFKAVVDARRW
ncbi:hypothetical protein [Lentzea sp. NPDC055074]